MFERPCLELEGVALRRHLLKSSTYFQLNLPEYISFDSILENVAASLGDEKYTGFEAAKDYPGVNYMLIANKKGMLDWRPLEFIHPVIYVSLTNLVCESQNWKLIKDRFRELSTEHVQCFSLPDFDQRLVTQDPSRTKGDANLETAFAKTFRDLKGIPGSWDRFQKQSISLSLNYDYMLQTDIVNCFGQIYTHSISWALYGIEYAKVHRHDRDLLGNSIDRHLQACRYGQTNGICQGSVLTDIIGELVLTFVDNEIANEVEGGPTLKGELVGQDFRVLRYRDDYRIFANSEECARKVLKVISDKLLDVGMKLSTTKTTTPGNVIESTLQKDAWTVVEQPYPLEVTADSWETMRLHGHDLILRLHSFGRKYPNSKELGLMMWTYAHCTLVKHKGSFFHNLALGDIRMLVAVVLDIAVGSPSVFPTVVFILSHVIAMFEQEDRRDLWDLVRSKVKRLPNNGYQDIWLQRIAVAQGSDLKNFESEERVCKIVQGSSIGLWENHWIECDELRSIMDAAEIVDAGALRSVSATLKNHELRRQLEQYISG